MPRTAKIIRTGDDQSVRLPAEFNFDSDEVLIRRDERTGDVILSVVKDPAADEARRRALWDQFVKSRDEAIAAGEIDDDFLSPKQRAQGEPRRDPFDGWEE